MDCPREDQSSSEDHARSTEALTDVMDAMGRGEVGAADRLLPLVYEELRILARSRMRHIPPGQTLQPTALVHEAWMRVADRRPEGWANRAEFFYAAARAMRDILVEDARRKGSLKRGGDRKKLILDEDSDLAIEPPNEDVIALDEAIQRLAAFNPEAANVVNLRYFAGLTVDEVAALKQVSSSTVERLWRFARAWLREALQSGSSPAADGTTPHD
jgi:RNA polymerase sigma factor (TIGR02999 family)